jgi:hypothetical protein
MVRYLNYKRLFINARQCFIVAFLTHARTRTTEQVTDRRQLAVLPAGGYGSGRRSVRRF